uniref:N-lysine methyltransferase KMT5A n=1 Tax=Equus caballus TaxID=9796 RepID=A0A9L0TER5_HORSE
MPLKRSVSTASGTQEGSRLSRSPLRLAPGTDGSPKILVEPARAGARPAGSLRCHYRVSHPFLPEWPRPRARGRARVGIRRGRQARPLLPSPPLPSPPPEPRGAAPASPSRAGSRTVGGGGSGGGERAGRGGRAACAPSLLRPRSRAGRAAAARGSGPCSQAMGEGGAVGRRRPFPGAPRRRWWRRQQQQQRQRQRWWPGRGGGGESEGAGRAAMGLAGLQEENSVAHHEVRCQGKPLAGIYRKREEKRNTGNAVRSTMKPEEQKIKDARRGPLAPFPNQKSEAAEPPKTPTLSCDSPNAAVGKQALKKPVKGKQAPRKKAQGKTQQNRKLTDFYPVRRSSRKSKAELQSEERKRIDELIESGKEEGMKIDLIDGKGRGVIATKQFSRGEFVVEYHGDLIEITDAKKREALYAQDPSTGCYMYYFQYLSKTYCVDATRETNRLGRLINHSKCGNCQTKLHDIDGVPHLILIASRDIAAGEELLYDYGDRSRASIEAYPWLKH